MVPTNPQDLEIPAPSSWFRRSEPDVIPVGEVTELWLTPPQMKVFVWACSLSASAYQRWLVRLLQAECRI